MWLSLNYYIGQAFGVLSSLCCLVMPLWKKKWQMLVSSAIANVAATMNLVFLGEFGSAAIINLVATVQVFISLWHVQKDKPVTRAENVIFFIVYVALGALGVNKAIDVLPIIGVVLFMFMAFQRDEQKTRMFTLGNATVFFVYYLVLGSTVVFAEIFAMVSSIIGLIKYRKKA